MKAVPIPERSRNLVKERERFRCARCLMGAPNGDWHHRRSRSVRDGHTHCPCNGVWLCRTCHAWAHAYPKKAQEQGLILQRYITEPWMVAFKTPLDWRVPDCEGGWKAVL